MLINLSISLKIGLNFCSMYLVTLLKNKTGYESDNKHHQNKTRTSS
jgi:hypothetical protein